MKKIIFASLILALVSTSTLAFQSAYAPYGFGAKFGAMGGAGSALCDDVMCVYYNPAAIASGSLGELKVGMGAATDGLNDIMQVVNSVEKPEDFLSQYFTQTFDMNGSLSALMGVKIQKVGVSVISVGRLNLTKPDINTLVGSSATAMFGTEAAATLGYRFAIPALPIGSLDLGLNIKSINSFSSQSTASGVSSSTEQVTKGTGTAFDLGARAGLEAGWPTKIAIVMRDISSTLKNDITTKNTTYNPLTGAILTQTTTSAAGVGTTSPVTTTIGVGTKIPVIGLVLAADLDSVSGSGTSYSVTHIGAEMPIAGGLIVLRGGMVSGGPSGSPISMTTYGAGIWGLNVALMLDSETPKNNSTIFDFGFSM
ncbi:MAG: hypothetical protein U9R38_06060 [Candidatus Margulisiibacteriota bacterium]|nr:hypothetical protein [Candidatus Margulisiibacteriota bacterium]